MSDDERKIEVKRFHGQVRIADVQEAFDLFVNRINELQTAYNKADDKNKTDYTLGSSSLAPLGYTLSVGGLKKLLEAYDGVVIGCKPIRIDSTRVKMTAGILITKTKGIELPDSIVNVSSSTKAIYFNKLTNSYTTTSNSNAVKICDINMNRESIFVSDRDNVQVEDVKGTHKIYTESRTFTNFAGGEPMTVNTSTKPVFVCALDAMRTKGQHQAETYLFGDLISRNNHSSVDSTLNYWIPVNFLYLPKGVSNPYEVRYADATKVFEVIEELNVKE